VSLAHHGVLFLDEMPEFGREAVEVMRQPMEDGLITLARASHTVTFPSHSPPRSIRAPADSSNGTARVPLHAAADRAYLAKISGPASQSLDLQVEMVALTAGRVTITEPAAPSSSIPQFKSIAKLAPFLAQ
jgi:magnesium chelatase family protein